MTHEKIFLDHDPSLNNNQNPFLTTYFLGSFEFNKDKLRPCVIVIPGGGYGHLSDREAEPIAIKMNELGFHSAVLSYSLAPMKFPAALLDLANAVKYIRENASKYNIDENKIIICGFSAGAHLSALLGVYWNKALLSKNFAAVAPEMLKPDALVLCYPVVTSGVFAHKDSIKNVIGDSDATPEMVSIEKLVDENFPPTFIWHTNEDTSVPAENSLLLSDALRKNKIDFEYHLFNRGSHGLSLSTPDTAKDDTPPEEECAVWPLLFKNWFSGLRI